MSVNHDKWRTMFAREDIRVVFGRRFSGHVQWPERETGVLRSVCTERRSRTPVQDEPQSVDRLLTYFEFIFSGLRPSREKVVGSASRNVEEKPAPFPRRPRNEYAAPRLLPSSTPCTRARSRVINGLKAFSDSPRCLPFTVRMEL